MEFGYTILYVKDVKKTLEFYQSCFGFEIGFLAEAGDYGELKTGTTKLAFASTTLADKNGVKIDTRALPNGISPAFELAFVTKDVMAAFNKAAEKGAAKIKPPEQKPWGQTVAYVRDMNGILVELCTPMK
ncbi:MAG: VOC family protein [Bdellovibrionaceae bacterium]|nr:VOC family protein [Pseudobdellovibrionaceae bacterium]